MGPGSRRSAGDGSGGGGAQAEALERDGKADGGWALGGQVRGKGAGFCGQLRAGPAFRERQGGDQTGSREGP